MKGSHVRETDGPQRLLTRDNTARPRTGPHSMDIAGPGDRRTAPSPGGGGWGGRRSLDRQRGRIEVAWSVTPRRRSFGSTAALSGWQPSANIEDHSSVTTGWKEEAQHKERGGQGRPGEGRRGEEGRREEEE